LQRLTSTDARKLPAQTPEARVMLLSQDPQGQNALRLGSYGCSVETETEIYSALSGMIDDPMGYDLFVMECDGFGGIAAAERAIATLIVAEARIRVILLSREFDAPAYPSGRRSAVSLPDPVSDANFRFGYEHVLRDRITQFFM